MWKESQKRRGDCAGGSLRYVDVETIFKLRLKRYSPASLENRERRSHV